MNTHYYIMKFLRYGEKEGLVPLSHKLEQPVCNKDIVLAILAPTAQ